MDTPTNNIATGGRHNGGTEVEAAREASRQARVAVRREPSPVREGCGRS